MCGVWVPLEDIDMDNGPLVYYPGSHKLPEIRMQDVGVDADPSQYNHYEAFIAQLIAERGLRPEYGTIKKGQALIWSANILHGGAPQRDMSRTRKSQVTHYYFEGCKYWTPLVSSEDHVAWRQPEWIT
jgi:ectoine hydroxylase-related dioxygenase (phytanoyl-CoA dioxygenase family)